MLFTKNGYTCDVPREPNEPFDVFCKRGWFVISQLPLEKDPINEIIRCSRLWIQVKHGCRYHSVVMNKLIEMEKEL
jgi:hypothetical protein